MCGKKFFTYLLECGDKSYYCGYTTDLEKRIETHSQGKGGRYTRTHLPVKIVYFETFAERKDAMKRELEIKKFSRKNKEALIKGIK
jgi:putative endonuclease